MSMTFGSFWLTPIINNTWSLPWQDMILCMQWMVITTTSTMFAPIIVPEHCLAVARSSSCNVVTNIDVFFVGGGNITSQQPDGGLTTFIWKHLMTLMDWTIISLLVEKEISPMNVWDLQHAPGSESWRKEWSASWLEGHRVVTLCKLGTMDDWCIITCISDGITAVERCFMKGSVW